MQYNAFITAGGRISGSFAENAGTDIKALVNINGATMLKKTVRALRESKSINRIALVAPGEIQNHPDTEGIDHFITASESGAENIRKGLEYFREDKYVILCTSDLPFISTEAVEDFLVRCPENASVCYPVFEKNEIPPDILPAIPSFIKLQDGEYTGGSLFRLEPSLLIPRMDGITRSFNARKKTLDMAKIMGMSIVLKMLLGICTLDDILKRGGEIVGGTCAAVRGGSHTITVDIDDENSYLFSVEYLRRAAGKI